MGCKIREGMNILSKQGPASLLREAFLYFYERIYWRINESYTLTAGGTEVEFTAPNRLVVQRNNRRFDSERQGLLDLLDEIEEDDVFYDIGANTGLYTLFAAKHRSTTKVLAFEPYPPNLQLLKRDVRRNALQNVDVFEVALSDSRGTVEFEQPEEDDAGYGSGSIESDSSDSDSTVTVQARSGDELVASGEAPAANIIKIDVEGAEPLVISGMESTLASPECRLVYCEVHRGKVDSRPSISDFDMTLSDIKKQFNELGFDVEEIQNRGSEVLLKAYK